MLLFGMKYHIAISFGFLNAICLISNAFATNTLEISLSDAISKGLVKAAITAKSPDSSSNFASSYYGPCLQLDLFSLTNTTLSLRLEAGRFMETADTNEQRMILTQEELIVLQPRREKGIRLFAMCTQMHDHSPGTESALTLNSMADGNLLTMARFISKNKFQSLAAQEAIWVITDNNDIGSIYSVNTEEMNALQSLVCKLTGKLPPPAPHSIFYASGMVSGEIVFENKQKETYSFLMMNETGEKIGTFFEGKTIDKPIVTTLTWRFRFNGFPKGIYYVKLLDSKNKEVVSRPVVIN